MKSLLEVNYSDDDFISVMNAELSLNTPPMTNELAQHEASADFITEQQQLRMGNNDNFSNY